MYKAAMNWLGKIPVDRDSLIIGWVRGRSVRVLDSGSGVEGSRPICSVSG